MLLYYFHFLQAANLASATATTVRIPINTETGQHSSFGVYAVPGLKTHVFVGPFKVSNTTASCLFRRNIMGDLLAYKLLPFTTIHKQPLNQLYYIYEIQFKSQVFVIKQASCFRPLSGQRTLLEKKLLKTFGYQKHLLNHL